MYAALVLLAITLVVNVLGDAGALAHLPGSQGLH